MNYTSQLVDNIISSASLNTEKKNFQFYRGRNMKPFYLDPKHFNELKNLIADHVLYDLQQGEKDENELRCENDETIHYRHCRRQRLGQVHLCQAPEHGGGRLHLRRGHHNRGRRGGHVPRPHRRGGSGSPQERGHGLPEPR